MIEISTIVFSLLIEALVILLLAIGAFVFISIKRKRKDRAEALKLVDQIKQQSEVRDQQNGLFLKQKYRLEGRELSKALESIDKSEKRFFQKVIRMYLNRDAEALASLDASVAELIDTYKSLSPVIPDDKEPEQTQTDGLEDEVERLKEANANLAEELKITKETMANMIAEFGNMFGGGSDNEMEQEEVVEKVIHASDSEQQPTEAIDSVESEDPVETAESSEQEVIDDIEIDTIAEEPEEEVVTADDIDDILSGLSPSDEKH